MKTNDFIDLLAQQNEGELAPTRSLTLSAVVAVCLSVVLLISLWGVRADLALVIAKPIVVAKYLFPTIVALPCLWLLAQSRRPEASLDGSLRWALLPAIGVLALVLTTLASLPTQSWLHTIVGTSMLACLLSIPALAAPILLLMLWALKQGAPSHPAVTGAVAGVAAGCLATAVYALHCYEDSPAFYGVWYSAGIGLVGLIGQRLGPRVLAW